MEHTDEMEVQTADVETVNDFEASQEMVVASTEAVRKGAGMIIRSEIVNDRWIRYTVREKSGAEHCVGGRVTPILTHADFVALKTYREARDAS